MDYGLEIQHGLWIRDPTVLSGVLSNRTTVWIKEAEGECSFLRHPGKICKRFLGVMMHLPRAKKLYVREKERFPAIAHQRKSFHLSPERMHHEIIQ